MRTAQIQSQVIVYILAVIIMGMTLIFGYKAFSDMNQRACDIQRIQFRSDLKSDIASIGIEFGTSKLKSYRMPCGNYRQICFVNLDHTDWAGSNDVVEQMKNIKTTFSVRDAVSSMIPSPSNPDAILAARKNLFFCPPCTYQDYVGNITLLDDHGDDTVFRCFNVSQGTLTLRIVGTGNIAQISNDTR
jgi:hypothetical protein